MSIGIEDDDAITNTADDNKKSNKKVIDTVVVAAIVECLRVIGCLCRSLLQLQNREEDENKWFFSMSFIMNYQ